MWPVIVLDALTFATFSSLMQFLGIVALGTLAMLSNLVSGTVSATMTLISSFFTTFVFQPAGTAIRSVKILWATCEIAIPRILSQFTGSLLLTAPSLSEWLFNSLPSPPDCSDGAVTGHSCTISYISALLQKTACFLNLILPPESAIPLSTMELFSWLARPIDDTGKTRADSIIDTCARKCAINRSHTTAPLVELGYLLAACTGLYDLTVSSNPLALAIMTLAIWWLRPAVKKPTVKQVGIPAPLRELVAQVQTDKQLCLGILQIGSEQRGQINKLNGDLASVIESERTKDDIIRVLRAQTAGLTHTNNLLNNQFCVAQHKAKDLQAQNLRLSNALHEAGKGTASLTLKCNFFEGKIMQLESELEALQQDHVDLLDATTEAHFEHELEKYTSSTDGPGGPSVISNFAVPFVLVLIDGDAYVWSTSHFAQSRNSAGANAAQAIKLEVQKFLIVNKAHIPIQSKIVVRVFQNIAGAGPTKFRVGDRLLHHANDISQGFGFQKDFTQSMPLFDYVDSGRGKERADSKIQETAHLFIANPSCYAMFLATATDNGFARLLEQYACDDAARKKIVIVHPGYIIREIKELGLNAVYWPSVFQDQYMPANSRAKAANLAAAAKHWNRETEPATAKFIFEKTWRGLNAFRNLATSGPPKEEGEVSRAAVDVSIADAGQLRSFIEEGEEKRKGDVVPIDAQVSVGEDDEVPELD